MASDQHMTRFGFDITGPVQVQATSLGNPARVILDLPNVEFRLPADAGRTGTGLVTGYRFGVIEEGKSRIVFDNSSPARIERALVVGPYPGGSWRLEVDLVPATNAELAARNLAEAARAIEAIPQPHEAPHSSNKSHQSHRPVIVIDPGHGGIDSGAEGASRLEKNLVLEVSGEVRRALLATHRYDVVMTRTKDVFVSLDERVRISQEKKADLFLSIHADSLPDKAIAATVRGATVYTLAEQASDAFARRMAEKENAVDLLAGLAPTALNNDQVRSILIDLMRRETSDFANDFRKKLVTSLASRIVMGHEPYRSGPFKVLRQAGSPAVLVELGYMSNIADETLMGTRPWQLKVAAAIRSAVDEHFRKRRSGP